MGLPNTGCVLQGTGKDQTVWKLEWTYSGTSGQVTLDTAQSDQDPRVATPVADSGTTGLTSITFPKCDRAWVLHCSLEVVTADVSDPTDYRIANVRDLSATAGTCTVSFAEFETNGALTDPNTDSRCRLILLLEYT
jgi:hypothetical protein